MPRILWDVPGTRVYFTGVDRGMLYLDDVAVPWPGLASVTEAASGADLQPYYLDGQKILNAASGEDFGGTIEAYGAPAEFSVCAGLIPHVNWSLCHESAKEDVQLLIPDTDR